MKKSRKIDKIAQELRKIAQAHGGLLLPKNVVESARSSSSPLHSRFEWNDSTAAEEYRLWQARHLIRVVIEQLPGVSTPTEVFVSLSSDRAMGAGYRVVTEVLGDRERRAEMLEDALAELQIFQLKYRRLEELAAVFRAVKTVVREQSGRGRKGAS